MRIFQLFIIGLLISFTALADNKVGVEYLVESAFLYNPLYKASVESTRSSYYNYLSSYGVYLPTVDIIWDKNNRNTENGLYISEGYTASAGLNLYQGFRGYNQSRAEYLRYQLAKNSEKRTRLNLSRDVKLSYHGLLKSRYLHETNKILYEGTIIVLQEAELKQKLDLITKADIYKAMADKEKAYTVLLDSEIGIYEAIQNLNNLTGLSLNKDTVFDNNTDFFMLEPLDYYLEMALINNSALVESNLNYEIADKSLNSSLGTFLPSLDLSASTSWNINKVDGSESKFNNNQIGITAKWNLFSGFSSLSGTLAAKKDMNSKRLLYSKQKADIEKEVYIAWLKADVSAKKLVSSELYLEAAKESYESLMEMFRLGRVSLKDTIDARAVYADAEYSLAETKYQLALNYEDLIFLTGGY